MTTEQIKIKQEILAEREKTGFNPFIFKLVYAYRLVEQEYSSFENFIEDCIVKGVIKKNKGV